MHLTFISISYFFFEIVQTISSHFYVGYSCGAYWYPSSPLSR
nr:MAG TPA: hypothetical protein [Caudoviricetes sp.]